MFSSTWPLKTAKTSAHAKPVRPKVTRRTSLKQWLGDSVGAVRRRLSIEKKREAALEKTREKTKENRAPEPQVQLPAPSQGTPIDVPVPAQRRAAGPLGDITDLYQSENAEQSRDDDAASFYMTTVSTPPEVESVMEEDSRSFRLSLRSYDDWPPRGYWEQRTYSNYELSQNSLAAGDSMIP